MAAYIAVEPAYGNHEANSAHVVAVRSIADGIYSIRQMRTQQSSLTEAIVTLLELQSTDLITKKPYSTLKQLM